MDEKETKPVTKPDGSEESLVKEYTEITGATEADARCVLMHLKVPEPEDKGAGEKTSKTDQPPA